MNLEKIGVVILAGGRGTRLNCVDIPKVMCQIGGRPIIDYGVETLVRAGFTPKQICIVIGFQKDKVVEHFGDGFTYAVQEKQLGTAHAAYVGMLALPPEIKTALVLNGDDSAFYTEETLLNLIQKHIESEAALTLLTVDLEDPTGYGRVIRHDDSFDIIEKESLTEEHEKIKEISTGTFVFDRGWYEEIFPNMPMIEKLGEYGLPMAVNIAQSEEKTIQAIKLQNPDEWFGVNRPHELEEADKRKQIKAE